MRLACFISSHGFGHATRFVAVAEALRRLGGAHEFHIYSQAPAWLFRELEPAARHHPVEVDPGLVQADALFVDLEATEDQLRERIPFDESLVDELSRSVESHGCEAVLCDIAPIGLAVAKRAGLASVLVENFTWDWIYRELDGVSLGRYADYLQEHFEAATWRIQVEPLCRLTKNDLRANPVSRRPRMSRAAVRQRLGLTGDERVVLLTFGGTAPNELPLDQLRERWPYVRFLVAGAGTSAFAAGVTTLAPDCGIDHPSLIGAVDAVIGKAGYSTIAETYAAGVPFACLPRPGFPESPHLEAFVETQMPSIRIRAGLLCGNAWVGRLDELFALRAADQVRGANGDEQVARFLNEVL